MENKENLFRKDIESIMPDRGRSMNYELQEARADKVKKASTEHQAKVNAAEIARIKYKEQKALERLEAKIKNPDLKYTKKELERLEQARENLATIEEIDMQADIPQIPEKLVPMMGTTRPEVVKLLTSLNINLSINLTKSDTYNLLSCLLTCNETQLMALYENTKVPIAIKTVIKRLLDDSRLGNIDTVEKLWDRVFGSSKHATLEMPQTQTIQTQSGILPGTVVSREAYTIIRDTIIGS